MLNGPRTELVEPTDCDDDDDNDDDDLLAPQATLLILYLVPRGQSIPFIVLRVCVALVYTYIRRFVQHGVN